MFLITGGTGVLGTELQKYIKHYAPKHDEFDFTRQLTSYYKDKEKSKVVMGMKLAKSDFEYRKIDLIIHCAAFTDLVRAEKEKKLCYRTNVIGTRNLAQLGIPMIYISTSYVFDGEKGNYEETDYPNPKNFYALTKLLGEYEALQNKSKTVVIRTLFKPRPFKHDKAITDQIIPDSYADEIAPEIVKAVRLFDQLPNIIHIGGEPTTTYTLARRTREVEPILLKGVTDVTLPRNTSLNCKLWRSICGNSIR